MFTLFNASAPSWNLILFALIEVILVAWVYDVDKFIDHLEEMMVCIGPLNKVTSWK